MEKAITPLPVSQIAAICSKLNKEQLHHKEQALFYSKIFNDSFTEEQKKNHSIRYSDFQKWAQEQFTFHSHQIIAVDKKIREFENLG